MQNLPWLTDEMKLNNQIINLVMLSISSLTILPSAGEREKVLNGKQSWITHEVKLNYQIIIINMLSISFTIFAGNLVWKLRKHCFNNKHGKRQTDKSKPVSIGFGLRTRKFLTDTYSCSRDWGSGSNRIPTVIALIYVNYVCKYKFSTETLAWLDLLH